MPQQQAAEVSMADYVKARSAGESVTEKAAITPEKEQIKTEPESAAGTQESEKDKSKGGGWQRRIDKLTRRGTELEESLKEEREARQRLEAKLAGRDPAELKPQTSVEPGARPEPRSGDLKADGTPKYADYDEFLRDVRKWDKEQLTQEFSGKLTEAQKKAQTEDENAKQEKVITESFQKKTQAAQAKYEDFKEVVFGEDSPVTEGLIQAGSTIDGFILDPENEGLEVLYHLCKHPEEIERISKFSPQKQIRELGKIEDTVLASADSETSPEPKKAALPAPIRPVSTSTSKSSVKPENMSMAEYAKWRQANR
jgi:hypothetical protein